MWQYQNTDELYHYGIPGMRWGIRRAQKILGSSDASVDKKKKAVQSLQKHQIKINKQIQAWRIIQAERNDFNVQMY